MAKRGLIVSSAVLIILIIAFIVFLVLYLDQNGKTSKLNDASTECTNKSKDLQTELDQATADYNQCEEILDQSTTSTIDQNFKVDTTSFGTPLFIRDNLSDQSGAHISQCNYPSVNPRFVYDSNNYQDCNFAFDSKGNPRCGTGGVTGGGYAPCSNQMSNGKLTQDPYTFLGYSDGGGDCVFWKVVNSSKFTYTLYSLTDSSTWQTVHSGAETEITSKDVPFTSGSQTGSSCFPIGSIIKISISYKNQTYEYVTPGMSLNFVITIWKNKTLDIPTITVGLAHAE